MDTEKIEQLKQLLEEGKKFNYKNFCQPYSGWELPKSYSTDYISWKTVTQSILESSFGSNDPVIKDLMKDKNTKY